MSKYSHEGGEQTAKKSSRAVNITLSMLSVSVLLKVDIKKKKTGFGSNWGKAERMGFSFKLLQTHLLLPLCVLVSPFTVSEVLSLMYSILTLLRSFRKTFRCQLVQH